MKKFYTLAAATVLAFGASAQSLYFLGAGQGLSWDADKAMEVKLENGQYKVTIADLTEFKMSTTAGTTWDEFNPGALFADGLSDKANLGKPLALTQDSGPNNGTPWKGEYTLVISGDLTTLTATTTTPEPVGFATLYLRGAMNNWDNDLENWKMETTDGVIYWFDCQGATIIPAGTEFKIADADWSAYNFGAGDTVEPFDEPLSWHFKGENGVMVEEYTGTIKCDISNGPRQDAMVTVYPEIVDHGTGAVENVEIDANAPAEYFNMQGMRVNNPENGLYIVRRGNNVTKVLVK